VLTEMYVLLLHFQWTVLHPIVTAVVVVMEACLIKFTWML